MSAPQPVLSPSSPKQTGEHLLYVCGGRSFHAAHPGNKIGGVARCWRAMGFQVSHICGGDVGQPASGGSTAPAYGAQAHFTAWYRANSLLNPLRHSLSEWRDIKHDRMMLQYLTELTAARPPVLVWERSARLHKAGLLLARRLGVPYVLEWKDNLVSYKASLFRRRALRIEEDKERQADWIVVESNVLKASLVENGRNPQRILVAHNAVDSAAFSPNPDARAGFLRNLGVPQNCVLVGYLGSYADYHDTPRLIEAAAQLQKQCAGQFQIVLVGAGRDRPSCESLAASLGLTGVVIFHEPVRPDEVPHVLAGLDIAVLPGSTDIICPIKVQEYMAAGLPVIAPDYPCNREVIAPGVSGLLFKPNDSRDLAFKIKQLVEDEGVRHCMGQAARQGAVDHFSWQSTWGAVLLTALAGSRADS